MKNKVKLVGKTTGKFKELHHFVGYNGENVVALETQILFTSKTGIVNTINVMVYKGSKFEYYLKAEGRMVLIQGELQSYRKSFGDKNLIEMFVAPKVIKRLPKEIKTQSNEVTLRGTVCGYAISKNHNSGVKVMECKLEVELEKGRLAYIRLVAFNDLFSDVNRFEAGDKIEIQGRIHSRTNKYKYKDNGEEQEIDNIFHEVCIHDFKYLSIEARKKYPDRDRIEKLSLTKIKRTIVL